MHCHSVEGLIKEWALDRPMQCITHYRHYRNVFDLPFSAGSFENAVIFFLSAIFGDNCSNSCNSSSGSLAITLLNRLLLNLFYLFYFLAPKVLNSLGLKLILLYYYILFIRSVERGICPIAALYPLRLWPFGVTWRHRSRDHWTRNIRFPISDPLKPPLYLA